MTVYVTESELSTALGADTLRSIADKDGDGAGDADVIAAALIDASGEADSYIQVAYPQPLTFVPPRLKRAVIQIANQLIRLPENDSEASRKGYEMAISWLKDVSTGKAILPGQPNVDDGVIDPGDPMIVASPRIMYRDQLTRLF